MVDIKAPANLKAEAFYTTFCIKKFTDKNLRSINLGADLRCFADFVEKTFLNEGKAFFVLRFLGNCDRLCFSFGITDFFNH